MVLVSVNKTVKMVCLTTSFIFIVSHFLNRYWRYRKSSLTLRLVFLIWKCLFRGRWQVVLINAAYVLLTFCLFQFVAASQRKKILQTRYVYV